MELRQLVDWDEVPPGGVCNLDASGNTSKLLLRDTVRRFGRGEFWADEMPAFWVGAGLTLSMEAVTGFCCTSSKLEVPNSIFCSELLWFWTRSGLQSDYATEPA